MRFANPTVGILMLLGLGTSAGAQGPTSDPRAVAIADQVMEALGGQAAWSATRFLRFDFAVERGGKQLIQRAHTWDKYTGRYRLEDKTEEGAALVVLMNLNSREGAAYTRGRALEGPPARKYVERAYETWVNDTYWLLMPYKMRDPGVILSYGGEKKLGEQAYETVILTFGNVGLTPKDKYWAYVNKTTHLLDRWEFVLTGEKGPPTPFLWKGWARYGKVMLAPERVNPLDGTRILFPHLAAPESLPETTFASPDGRSPVEDPRAPISDSSHPARTTDHRPQASPQPSPP